MTVAWGFENSLENRPGCGNVLVWPDGPLAARQSRAFGPDWGAFGFLSVPGPDAGVWQPQPDWKFGS